MDKIEGFFGTLTPLQRAINRATDKSVREANWELNLDIIDEINRGGEKNIKTATKQLFRRLGQSEDNVKMLSLELLQSCMNECGAGFHAEVGKRMKTMSELCTSNKYSRSVQMKAIEMVAKWGRSIKAYGVLQVFYQTFVELKRKGVKFPEKDEGAPMFSPPATSTPPIVVKAKPIVSERQNTTNNTASTKISEEQRSRAFSSTEFIPKLEMDLNTVQMRLNLFTEMFASMTVASTPDQVLLEGLDFLDQCVPRLKRLINASVSGKIKISEKTVGLLFSLNDDVSNLINTFIEAERGGFLDLEKAKKLIKSVKKETTTSTKEEEDEDEEELQGPTPVAAPKVPKIQNQASTESVDHGNLLADIFDDIPPASSSSSSKDETAATTTDLDDLFGLT